MNAQCCTSAQKPWPLQIFSYHSTWVKPFLCIQNWKCSLMCILLFKFNKFFFCCVTADTRKSNFIWYNEMFKWCINHFSSFPHNITCHGLVLMLESRIWTFYFFLVRFQLNAYLCAKQMVKWLISISISLGAKNKTLLWFDDLMHCR